MPNSRVTTQELYREIRKINEILTGNGHPEEGMCVKQALMAKCLQDIQENHKESMERINSLEQKQQYMSNKLAAHTGYNGKDPKTVLGLTPEIQGLIWKWFIRAGITFMFGKEAFNKLIN